MRKIRRGLIKIRGWFVKMFPTEVMERLIAVFNSVLLVSTFISGVFIYEVSVNYFFESQLNMLLGTLGVFIGVSTMIYAMLLFSGSELCRR